ncbi:MAG: family 16 glycosylhydrolase [Candidatus Brockarchaeota archaeon]|nr:family 16 glycosylhydrolase [Candidatus Brockarchaeota archaeon]MBO3809660.1 family 16 glycosylhydrolase [Candidatus Brockarchaeota archaeon]
MEEQKNLRVKVAEEGGFSDDFETKSPYWSWRVDNHAGFEVKGSVLKMWMGPTEALYYSNAEIADGLFDDLPWMFKTFETKARLLGEHYGSAGCGFWNHTMVTDRSLPIWFIYLRTRRPYPFSGFFAQVGNRFQPIMLLEKNSKFTLASILSKISSRIIGVDIVSSRPTMQELKLDEWHEYRVEWVKQGVSFYVDGREVAKIPFAFKEERARADVWIDNAVYEIRKGDPGGVYRHATQENREKAFLEVDYIRVL